MFGLVQVVEFQVELRDVRIHTLDQGMEFGQKRLLS